MEQLPEHSKQARDLFDAYAEQYQENHGDVSKYAVGLGRLLAELPAGPARILDLACGPGNLSHFLLDRRPDLRILGLDLAPNMLSLARQLCPTAEFRQMDCRRISDLAQQFDAILIGFALPYLNRNEAMQLIADACRLLPSGGLLYLSTMEADLYHSKLNRNSQGDSLTQFFHTAIDLQQEMKKGGLELLHEGRVKYRDQSGDEGFDLILVGKKR